MHERVTAVTLFVCLSVCLSICLSVCLSAADLKDGGLLVLQRNMNLNRMTTQVPSICDLFEIRPCSREKAKKTVLFEHTLDHTH